MIEIKVTDDTPISLLTVGQQKELFLTWFSELLGKKNQVAPSVEHPKRYVYGVAGIASLFQVSYATAIKLKDGVLKPAVMQQGRKIICDAELAMKLFAENSGK